MKSYDLTTSPHPAAIVRLQPDLGRFGAVLPAGSRRPGNLPRRGACPFWPTPRSRRAGTVQQGAGWAAGFKLLRSNSSVRVLIPRCLAAIVVGIVGIGDLVEPVDGGRVDRRKGYGLSVQSLRWPSEALSSRPTLHSRAASCLSYLAPSLWPPRQEGFQPLAHCRRRQRHAMECGH